MSPPPEVLDPLHVAARGTLLDALDAVAPLRRALILVGAQAVYLRTANIRLPLQPFTSDGDLAIDPRTLPDEPSIEASLMIAGFTRSDQPGGWRKAVMIGGRQTGIDVDFLVPQAVAPGTGSRSVELPGHDRMAARRVFGLEAALVDHGPMRVASLDPKDRREAVLEVAGPAALFIAKIHKIAERIQSGRQLRTPVDKDAADILRLIQGTPVRVMGDGFRVALSAEASKPVAELAMRRAMELFGRSTAPGVQMAIRAVGVAGEPAETVAAILTSYSLALASETNA